MDSHSARGQAQLLHDQNAVTTTKTVAGKSSIATVLRVGEAP